MKYESIDNQLFIQNRAAFCAKIKANSIAIFHSNDEFPRNGDASHAFRQNSDLFYLSGIDQAKSILVLYPDAPLDKYKEMLFVEETSEAIAIWDGKKYSKSEATAASGIKNVFWLDSFDKILGAILNHSEGIYINLNENDRAGAEIENRDVRAGKKLRAQYPFHQYYRSAPIMGELRAVKQEIEISLMQRAADITNTAFRRILKDLKPGMMEFEVEAIIMHEFLAHRATGPAYHSIVASGPNACVLHYNDNNQECRDGDLILMDFGAEYANYAADLTRTIPVNGKFTERQKEVYNACHTVMNEGFKLFRPGTTLNQVNVEAGKIMESELKKIGLISDKDIANQNPNVPAYKKYFMHGLGHFLGLDVHDVGNRYGEIRKGMSFTNEPGIYIREEGLGIRIENDIIVTDGDPIDLMKNTPSTIEEIEDLMASN